MLKLAESEPGIAVAPSALDADLWSLNVLNGTLDLHTGQLRPHQPIELLTKVAPVDYDPQAQYPTWDAFLLCRESGK
jgi:putative DNA primase/helicase